MRHSVIFFLTAVFFFVSASASAGNPDSPAPPDDPASAVHTFEDLYYRLLEGRLGEKRTGAFSEPASGPGVYGHSINDIMSIAPEPDSDNAASPEDVPEGMIFWCVDPAEGRWGKQTGTMPNQGAVNIIPSATEQTIPAGYHNGSGTIAGDADLLPENIISGKEIFGVAGSIPDKGAVSITPGTAEQKIPAGYHNGSGTVAGDANLVTENIAAGKTVFGIAGSAPVASGDAAAGDVLAGRTFSKTGAAGVTGTMPDNGAVNITPGTANQAIPAGYHNGSGTVAGDADLASGNIKSGVDIFGVTGTSVQASGAAVAGEVLATKTFSNSAGASTGTMPNNGAVNITPGTANQSIPAGYHNGSGSVAGDANLVSGNIRDGVSIFGVPGGVKQPSGDASAGDVLIGKTFSNAGAAGVSGARYPSPVYTTGQTFTDNGDGTVTDNRTGLMWMKDANLAFTAAYDPNTTGNGKVDWNNAGSFITELNSGAYTAYNCGYNDWRLPHINELFSLIDMANYNPALPSGHPFSNVRATYYWSATANAHDTSDAWFVSLGYGGVGFDVKSVTVYVWPVR